jgi:hypothetical protein
MNTFRDHLQDTLKQQGGILQTVGKGMSGALLLLPGVSPAPDVFAAGLGAAGVLTGVYGSARVQRWQPPVPVSLQGKNKLKVAGNVVNQIEKASKSGSKIASFA